MRLWLLTDQAASLYCDSYDAHLVSAESEDIARSLVPHGDEGDIWKDPTKTKCEDIGESTKYDRCIVLSSFNAG